jgi:hypothetical protein
LIIVNFSGLPPATNGSDHPHRQPTYLNQVNVHKHHTPQHTVPVQSAYLASSPVSRNGLSPLTSANIYHFPQQVEFFHFPPPKKTLFICRLFHLLLEEENLDIIPNVKM